MMDEKVLMTEVPVDELRGEALDWAVAEALGAVRKPGHLIEFPEECPFGWIMGLFRPSYEWRDGGPLVGKYISFLEESKPGTTNTTVWSAGVDTAKKMGIHNGSWSYGYGDTPLVAAMLAIVGAKFGRRITIPTGLVGSK